MIPNPPFPYPTPLTPATIDPAFQALTLALLGMPFQGAEANFEFSRIGWQQRGQPFGEIAEDISFVRCYTVDDQYNRVREEQQVPNPADKNDPPQSIGMLTTYVRVWECSWELYGPNSFDYCRQLRSGLFTQVLHDTFAALGLALYLVTDPAEPQYIPYSSDGQWWKRTDFRARFNENVFEFVVIPVAQSVQVTIDESRLGQLAQFTTELQD
jgi:hypothetical protein